METLYLSNDLTGSTELCSLFLHPDYREGYNGKWLSKCRFLFIAQYPQLFTTKIIAEMREAAEMLADLGREPGLARAVADSHERHARAAAASAGKS